MPLDQDHHSDYITTPPVTTEDLDSSSQLNQYDGSDADTSSSNHVPHTPEIVENYPRQSIRPRKQPVWMNDFVCQVHIKSYSNDSIRLGSSTLTPYTYPFIIPKHFTPTHLSFVANIFAVQDPSNYSHAKDNEAWVASMKSEIEALEKNQTWEIINLPTGKRPIGCKQVYKLKLKLDRNVYRYKARLVAKGYHQIEGIDFQESFHQWQKL